MRTFFLSVTGVLAAIFAGGCTRTANDMVVERPGLYALAPDDLSLQIAELPGGLVGYSVNDGAGRTLTATPTAISIYHRWFAYWEKDAQRLWFYSGDRGTFLHQRGPDGRFRTIIVTPEDVGLIRQMPLSVFERMPRSFPVKPAALR